MRSPGFTWRCMNSEPPRPASSRRTLIVYSLVSSGEDISE